ncbi:MAG: hypothetical protein WBM50_18935 [Acidimicrobiales bacterium]
MAVSDGESESGDSLDSFIELAHLGERGSRAGLAGFVFAVLFVAAWLLLNESPPFDAPAADIIDYFGTSDERRSSFLAGFYLLPLAGVAFIWYAGALRARIHRAGGLENRLLSTVQLMAGTLFVVAIILIGVIEVAVAWGAEAATDGAVDVESARTMLALGAATGQIFVLRSGAVFIGVSATRASRSGLFPDWFAFVSLALAVGLLFVVTTWQPAVLIIPGWVVVTSVVVLAQRRNRLQPVEV